MVESAHMGYLQVEGVLFIYHTNVDLVCTMCLAYSKSGGRGRKGITETDKVLIFMKRDTINIRQIHN